MNFKEPIWFDCLPSTNSYLKQLLSSNQDLPNGTVIAAKSQTEGKGRAGRSWLNFPGENLTFSWLLKTDVTPEQLPTLPLVVSLAMAEFLIKNFNLPCRLKWPNDILIDGKKLCGILAEFLTFENSIAVIVGIGLNVNMDESSAEMIGRPATSILIETGKKNGIENLLKLILEQLPEYVEKWEKGGFSAIRHDWIELCDNIGKQIVVTAADGKTQKGMFEELGENGQILLKIGEGEIKEIWAGDIFAV